MKHSEIAPLRYSLPEVAQLLGLRRSTLYTRINEGKLCDPQRRSAHVCSASELEQLLGNATGQDGYPTSGAGH